MVKVEYRPVRDQRTAQPVDEPIGHYKRVKEFVHLYAEAEEKCRRAFQRKDEETALQAIREMRDLESRIAFQPGDRLA